jgi:hypothetical protein
MGSFGLWLTKGTQSSSNSARTEEDPGKALHGARVGIGLVMEVEESSGNIFISDLLPNTAAWHSSLCVGDRITHVDGVPVRGKLAAAVNDLLMGTEGSVVELRVEARSAVEGSKVRSIHADIAFEHKVLSTKRPGGKLMQARSPGGAKDASADKGPRGFTETASRRGNHPGDLIKCLQL